VLAVSAATGDRVDDLRAAVARLAADVRGRRAGGARLAVDRAFTVKGRGTVATGSLRGGPVATGATLRLVPGASEVRVREVQVRGTRVDAADGGRTALLLAAAGDAVPGRGQVLTSDASVVATSRLLVAIRPPAGLATPGRAPAPPAPPADRDRLRLHLGTAQAGALVVRGPREAIDLPDGSSLAILRLDAEVAAAPGDRFALRHPSPGSTAGGGVVLDPQPPRGVSRRRLTPDRVAALASALGSGDEGEYARTCLDLHGAIPGRPHLRLAPDVEEELRAAALELVAAHHATDVGSAGLPLAAARASLALAARRRVTLGRADADAVATDVLERMVGDGALARDGDRLRDPGRGAGLASDTLEAMDRLEAALAVPAPPPLAAAAREAGCPPDGIRALEQGGRIVRLEDDLAWAATTYRGLVKRALSMAAIEPLSPAAFRDATGTSRRVVLVILEDMDRRGLLRRTDTGHVLGPRAIARMEARAATRGTAR
jgi:selenocysteine-specific elongation factor